MFGVIIIPLFPKGINPITGKTYNKSAYWWQKYEEKMLQLQYKNNIATIDQVNGILKRSEIKAFCGIPYVYLIWLSISKNKTLKLNFTLSWLH